MTLYEQIQHGSLSAEDFERVLWDLKRNARKRLLVRLEESIKILPLCEECKGKVLQKMGENR